MLALLCSLALAADLPLPAPRAPTRRHTAIVMMHTGEFAAGSGLATALVGLVAWRSGACYGDEFVCSIGIVGAVTTGVGAAGVAVGVPILLGGAMLIWDPGNPSGPPPADRAASVKVGLVPNGVRVWHVLTPLSDDCVDDGGSFTAA